MEIIRRRSIKKGVIRDVFSDVGKMVLYVPGCNGDSTVDIGTGRIA